MRFQHFARLVVALVAIFWSTASYAWPSGVDSQLFPSASGCNDASCHGGAGTALSSAQVRVNGGPLMNLTGTPTFRIPPVTGSGSVSTFEVHFHNNQAGAAPCGITGGCPGGGFLVLHNDASMSDANGTLKASGAGTQACTDAAPCAIGVTNHNTEVTHSAPFPGPDVVFTFGYTPPVGCGVVNSTFPFRLWMNAVNGDGGCGPPDEATAFNFNVQVSCDDSNDCTTDGCGGGSCSHIAISCPAADSCNNASVCVAAGGCQPRVPKSSATVCNDNNACTGTGATPDHCNGAGTCVGGATVACQLGDACWNDAACVPASGCQPRVAKPNTTTCNDGNGCTGTAGTPDHCDGAGTCVAGATVTCPTPDACHNAVTCTANACPALPAKPDGTLCGVASSCVGNVFHPHQACTTGVCGSPATVTCNGTCDPTTGCGGCTADTDCLANNYCDKTGTCVPSKTTGTCNTAAGTSGGDCKVAGCKECKSGNCVDGFCCDTACAGGVTTDCVACNVTGMEGTCSNLASTVGCNADNSACTQNDHCDGAGKCLAGTAVTCRAPQACEQTGVCNAANGVCSFALVANGTTCAKSFCDANGVTLHPAAVCGGAATCPAQTTMDCYPNQCVGALGSAMCGNGCTIDANCAAGAFCNNGTCADKKLDGGACKADNECKESHCVDGVCCNDACSGQCEACDVQGKVGSCVPVSGPPHGKRDACANDGTGCGGQCDGVNNLGCAFPDSSTTCRNESCNAQTNTGTLKAGCNGAGACSAVQTVSCSPFVCGATRCNGDCQDSDSQCSPGHYCAAGVCKNKLNNGDICGTTNQCSSGYCVDGVCCDGACTDQCRACDVMGKVGTCTVVSDGPPHGGRLRCEGADACRGTCDGTSPTSCTLPAEGKLCSDPSCTDGIATLAAGCDGKGACKLADKKECMPFACGVTACRTACANAHDDCAKGFDCIAGVCTMPSTDAGVATDDAAAATSPDASVVAPMPDGAAGGSPMDASVGAPVVDAGAESGTPSPSASDQGGCGCHVPGSPAGHAGAPAFVVALALFARRRRRVAVERRCS
jgi:MYXO-CTERM domain-containing protein